MNNADRPDSAPVECSGTFTTGCQEETTVLGVPCLTLRNNTERPVTLTDGTNRLVGSDPDAVLAAVDEVLAGKGRGHRVPELWDGAAAERIATTLEGLLPGCRASDAPARTGTMRILFLSHYFPPEVNAPAVRTFEHCRQWARAGHEVHVITCVPSHPGGVAFAGYRSTWYRRDTVDGVFVHRVLTLLAPNAGVFRRTLSYLSFIPFAVWRGLRLGRVDVIVATSPQFFCAVAGCLLGALKRTPWVFEVRDLWPHSIRSVGAVSSSLALWILEKLELAMYRHASRVVCVARPFVDDLERRGVDPSKLVYLPNGVHPKAWCEGNRQSTRAELGLGRDSVLVSYVGTVGMAHGLGTVLDAACLLRERQPTVRLLVVGDGAELPAIRDRASAESLHNVTLTGLVPRERVRDYLAATDISLVVLKKSPMFELVLPSKLFEAMAAARPVVLGVAGEARRVLKQSRGGVAVPPGDAAALAHAVGRLAGDCVARARMGAAGRSFVTREFSRVVWAERYLTMLESLPPSRGKLQAAQGRSLS